MDKRGIESKPSQRFFEYFGEVQDFFIVQLWKYMCVNFLILHSDNKRTETENEAEREIVKFSRGMQLGMFDSDSILEKIDLFGPRIGFSNRFFAF